MTKHSQNFYTNDWYLSDVNHPLGKLENTTVTNPLTQEFVNCSIYGIENGSLCFSPKLEDVVIKILNTEPARNLLNKALRKGSINILPGDQYNTPTGSIWMFESRTILVDPEKEKDTKPGYLLLGIAEALNSVFQKKIAEKSHKGLVGRDAYIKLSERLGFETAKTFGKVVRECIKNHQWSHKADLKMSLFLREITNAQGQYSWDKYWKRVKESDHSELFGENWDNVIGDVYCEKNPEAKDCVDEES